MNPRTRQSRSWALVVFGMCLIASWTAFMKGKRKEFLVEYALDVQPNVMEYQEPVQEGDMLPETHSQTLHTPKGFAHPGITPLRQTLAQAIEHKFKNSRCPDYAEIADRELRPFISEGIGSQEVAVAFEVLEVGKRVLMSINETGAYLHFDPVSINDRHIKRCFNGFTGTFRFDGLQKAILDAAAAQRKVDKHPGKRTENPTVVWAMNLHASDIITSVPNRLPVPIPVMSYSKARGNFDILFPRPYLNEFLAESNSYDNTLERYGEWNSKRNVAVFRGALTHHLREELSLFSMAHPELADAGITQFVMDIERSPNLTIANEITMIDQLRNYKYIFYVDGHGSADRFPFLLASDTTAVLMPGPDSKNLQMSLLRLEGRPVLLVEFFWSLLKPGVHFHPFRTDIQDLEEAILYLQNNDEYARQIALNGAKFTKTMLTRDMIQCYMEELAVGYFNLQRESGQDILNFAMQRNPSLQTIKIEFCDSVLHGVEECKKFID